MIHKCVEVVHKIPPYRAETAGPKAVGIDKPRAVRFAASDIQPGFGGPVELPGPHVVLGHRHGKALIEAVRVEGEPAVFPLQPELIYPVVHAVFAEVGREARTAAAGHALCLIDGRYQHRHEPAGQHQLVLHGPVRHEPPAVQPEEPGGYGRSGEVDVVLTLRAVPGPALHIPIAQVEVGVFVALPKGHPVDYLVGYQVPKLRGIVRKGPEIVLIKPRIGERAELKVVPVHLLCHNDTSFLFVLSMGKYWLDSPEPGSVKS